MQPTTHINFGMNETRTHDHRYILEQNNTSYATEVSKIIPNLPTIHWQIAFPQIRLR